MDRLNLPQDPTQLKKEHDIILMILLNDYKSNQQVHN